MPYRDTAITPSGAPGAFGSVSPPSFMPTPGGAPSGGRAPGAVTPTTSPSMGNQQYQPPQIPALDLSHIREASAAAKRRAHENLTQAGLDPNQLYDQYLEASGANKDRKAELTQEEKSLLIVELGLRMMAGGDRPGASALGVLGEAGGGTIGSMRGILDQRRGEMREDRRDARADAQYRTGAAMSAEERDMNRQNMLYGLDRDDLAAQTSTLTAEHSDQYNQAELQMRGQQLQMEAERLNHQLNREAWHVAQDNAGNYILINRESGETKDVLREGERVQGLLGAQPGRITPQNLANHRANARQNAVKAISNRLTNVSDEEALREAARSFQLMGHSPERAELYARNAMQGSSPAAVYEDALTAKYLSEILQGLGVQLNQGMLDDESADAPTPQNGALPPNQRGSDRSHINAPVSAPQGAATPQGGALTQRGVAPDILRPGFYDRVIGPEVDEASSRRNRARAQSILDGSAPASTSGFGASMERRGGLMGDITLLLEGKAARGTPLSGGRASIPKIDEVLSTPEGIEILTERIGPDGVVRLREIIERAKDIL